MICRKHYVFVIGEHEHVFGGDLIASLCNIFRRRIHGLTAFDYAIYEQISENGGYAVARANRHKPERLEFLDLLLLKLAVLLKHVFDLEMIEFAEFERISEHLTGRV